MNHRIAGRNNRFVRKLLLGGLLIGAAILLIAAFMQSEKQNAAAGWVPLNEAVQNTLEELEAGREADVQETDDTREMETVRNQETSQSSPGEGNKGNEPLDEEVQAASNEKAAASNGEGAALASRDEAGRLDLNRATAAELDELKGIGPSKAQAIVEDRESNGFFSSVEDLLRVKGIGEKLLAGIKDSVVTRP
jgi:competence protein ComEA